MDSGESPRDDDDRGDALRALFEREQAHVAEQPFVNDIARRIAAARRRRTLVTRATQAAAVGALIAASRWLVDGSELLSAKLDALFAHGAAVLATPLGMLAGALCLAVLVVVNRRRLF